MPRALGLLGIPLACLDCTGGFVEPGGCSFSVDGFGICLEGRMSDRTEPFLERPTRGPRVSRGCRWLLWLLWLLWLPELVWSDLGLRDSGSTLGTKISTESRGGSCAVLVGGAYCACALA